MTQGTITAAISRNPATGELLATYPFVDEMQMHLILEQVDAGYRAWSQKTVAQRCHVLAAMAALLLERIEEIASTVTAEMGKPITQSRAEVRKAANALEWYALNGAAMLEDTPTSIGPEAFVAYRPLGAILAVEPWNFPIWQIMRGGSTILLGGNAYVLKPAPNAVGCALLLERLWIEAGLPKGAFSVLNAENHVVSAAIEHDTIAGITVTGSVGAGAAIATQAGRVLKRVVLELGGTDPFIVLSDADIDAAVEGAIIGRFHNAGQICISAKRIILAKEIAEEFTQKFVERVSALNIGDPTDEATFIGPIARTDIRDEIQRQIAASVEQGATVLTGGKELAGPGNYLEPTVLGGVTREMTAFREEIFGPVAALIIAEDTEHAIELANDSEFGLSSSIYSKDENAALALAPRLHTGGVFINSSSVSDPRIPIGGIKKSGFGRELSHFGVHEFMNIQSVWNRSND